MYFTFVFSRNTFHGVSMQPSGLPSVQIKTSSSKLFASSECHSSTLAPSTERPFVYPAPAPLVADSQYSDELSESSTARVDSLVFTHISHRTPTSPTQPSKAPSSILSGNGPRDATLLGRPFPAFEPAEEIPDSDVLYNLNPENDPISVPTPSPSTLIPSTQCPSAPPTHLP